MHWSHIPLFVLVMLSWQDFYQAPFVKDNYFFQNIKNNVNALAPNF